MMPPKERRLKGLTRFGVSIPSELLARFDALIARKGYANRSEALRDLIRDRLVEEEWTAGKGEVVGTVTLVYDHHVRELTRRLTELQHHHHAEILSTLHIHLDEHRCLEVLAVRGKAGEVRGIADRLIGTKGVKHGKLVMTTTGRALS
jgi:CopG family nickel-responsive transcriptional regulator